MFRYIVKRLLLFVPTFFLVSCLAFFLSRNVPSDPVEIMLNLQGMEDSNEGFSKAYQEKYEEMKYHLPEFYFSFHPNYMAWITQDMGDRPTIEFMKSFAKGRYSRAYIENLVGEIKQLNGFQQRYLYASTSPTRLLDKLNRSPDFTSEEKLKLEKVIIRWENHRVGYHYPKAMWNGLHNQYHHWVSGFIKGDFGLSMLDARPVIGKIWEAMKWTLFIITGNIFFVLLISFPLGIYSGLRAGSTFDLWISRIFFAIYSIPKFWLATLMIIFFTTVEYGTWTNIFPNVGLWFKNPEDSFLTMMFSSLDKLILPLLVLVIPDAAYLTRLIRSSIIEEKSKEYIKTALSKGMSEMHLVKKHLIPNSLIPTITLIVGVMPAAIASALVIEVIFNIPGVGRLMYDSLALADWAVVYPILMLISILAVVFYLVGDILMAWLNPKINLKG